MLQEVHILEENLDTGFHDSSIKVESSPVKPNGRAPQDTERSEACFCIFILYYHFMTMIPFQGEMDQMRKRMTEMEMKHARTVHDVRPSLSAPQRRIDDF